MSSVEATRPRPHFVAKNLAPPVRLTGVRLGGFSAEPGRPGKAVKVWTHLAITSDQPIFHRMVEGLRDLVSGHCRKVGKIVDIAHASSVLLVIHPDETADVWVDSAAVVVNALTRRAVKAGGPVYESDIADVAELAFPDVDITAADRLVYLFRGGWRFALLFDLRSNGTLSMGDVSRTLGALFRNLKYRHLYDALSDEAVFGRLVQAGWFPFVEIIGRDFRLLADTCAAGFDLDDAEAEIERRFDAERLEQIFARWNAKPNFKLKEAILRSAIDAFKRKDSVSVLKIVLTEIEGVLQAAHKAATGKSAKLTSLLKFAVASAERKAGGPGTLLFPAEFGEYLRSYTFANFDPDGQSGVAGSRHAVGHGAAHTDTYTQPRALQALLTLDQIAFYT